ASGTSSRCCHRGEAMTSTEACMQQLAILGGAPAIADPAADARLFHWPIVTDEDERAVVEVMRTGRTSGTDVTRQFEAEYAAWQGSRYALGVCNGTAGLLAAMWACGVGAGDEVICPG